MHYPWCELHDSSAHEKAKLALGREADVEGIRLQTGLHTSDGKEMGMGGDRMRIVVTDGFTLNPGDNPWDEIGRLGTLAVYDRTSPAELIERCRDGDILIVNKTQVREASMGKLPQLRYITVAATGYDCVDIEAAGRRGIPVSNVPVYGTDSVAQYVFSALLHLSHNISDHDAAVKGGEWARSPDWSFWKRPLVELAGKTLGIVGFGRIGRRVGELAHAFGMRVLAHDTYHGIEPGYTPFAWSEMEELFAASDFVSLHCPLTGDNRGFVNRALLGRMRPDAILINASRGPLVDEGDLAAALNAGGLAAAVVDVVAVEPIRPGNPLLSARNLVITPHLAWATREARKRLMGTTADNVRAFQAGAPRNVVNQAHLSARPPRG
jgi:glycerate dehydrogenase